MRKGVLASLLAVSWSGPIAAMPQWAKTGSQSLSGSIYKVACSGTGPAIDVARADAINSCKISASQMLDKDVRVRSLSVETNNDVTIHQEVAESATIRNLVCTPERDEAEDSGDGSYTVWVLCRFDLSKTAVASDPSPAESQPKSTSKDMNAHLSALSVKQFDPKSANQRSGDERVVNIVSVPQCDDLLIRGGRPRTARCDKSPTQVPLYPGDESIIVRAKGYVPKTIEVNQEHQESDRAIIQVILEGR